MNARGPSTTRGSVCDRACTMITAGIRQVFTMVAPEKRASRRMEISASVPAQRAHRARPPSHPVCWASAESDVLHNRLDQHADSLINPKPETRNLLYFGHGPKPARRGAPDVAAGVACQRQNAAG